MQVLAPGFVTVCSPSKLGPSVSDHLLVRRDYRLAGLECPADPFGRRFLPSDELDHDVDLRPEHGPNVIRPHDVSRYPVNSLPLDVAVQDVSQAKVVMGTVAQDARHRLTDRSETQERHRGHGHSPVTTKKKGHHPMSDDGPWKAPNDVGYIIHYA